MKRRTKASLNLSVNAIVVFVLAFAMLGVGITFINLLKDKLLEGTKDIIPKEELQNPASADEPLTVPGEITVKANEGKEETIGYYNTMNSEAENAKLGITECVATGGGGAVDAGDIPGVDSMCSTLETSESTGFKVFIHKPENLDADTTYICSMAAYNGGGGCDESATGVSDEQIYHEEDFYLKVKS